MCCGWQYCRVHVICVVKIGPNFTGLKYIRMSSLC